VEKRAKIHLIGIPTLVLIAMLVPTVYFLRSNNNLKERAKFVEQQLAETQSVITELGQTNESLTARLKQSADTIRRLEEREGSLRRAISILGKRVDELERGIRGFIDGLDEIDGTVGEIGTLIQDSLGILRAIQERSK
jgi:predicted nuclease with TOPRIM domain